MLSRSESLPNHILLCWPQDPGGPGLPAINWRDCGPLVTSMREGDKRFAEMHFSRDENRGFKLPHTMAFRTCVIRLTFTYDDGQEDDYKFRELSSIADAVIRECVIKLGSLGVGGATHFGRYNKMTIMVRGQQYEDPSGKSAIRVLPAPVQLKTAPKTQQPTKKAEAKAKQAKASKQDKTEKKPHVVLGEATPISPEDIPTGGFLSPELAEMWNSDPTLGML